MDDDVLAELRAQQERQAGVISWAQARQAGLARHDLERMLRRRELVRVHPRVYVDHTGPLSWEQRAWAAVLHAAPAALVLGSAAEAPDPDLPIEVAVEASRRVRAPPGVRIHRLRDLDRRVRWTASPPRVRVEHNVLERVDRARDEGEVVRLLSDEVSGRRTTVARIREALDGRPRLARRSWVLRVLEDLDLGACSVLEQGFLTLVERPHGLPETRRQSVRRGAGGVEYRDVEFVGLGQVVELDGQLGHAGWRAAGRDADRDLDARADGDDSVRLRWAQVFDRPCRTAARLGRVLARRGWTGELTPCSDSCEMAA